MADDTTMHRATAASLLQVDVPEQLDRGLYHRPMLFNDARDLERAEAIPRAAFRTDKFESFQAQSVDRRFQMVAAVASDWNENCVGIGHNLPNHQVLPVTSTVNAPGNDASPSTRGVGTHSPTEAGVMVGMLDGAVSAERLILDSVSGVTLQTVRRAAAYAKELG